MGNADTAQLRALLTELRAVVEKVDRAFVPNMGDVKKAVSIALESLEEIEGILSK